MLADTSASMWIKRLGCHADLYTVCRCHTRGESEDHTGKKAWKGSNLTLKPRADITRSPKQRHQWPHRKVLCLKKNFKKKEKKIIQCLIPTMESFTAQSYFSNLGSVWSWIAVLVPSPDLYVTNYLKLLPFIITPWNLSLIKTLIVSPQPCYPPAPRFMCYRSQT